MELHNGISGVNLVTYALVYFVTLLALQVIYSFVVFILTDPLYYNIDKDEISSIMGTIGMYSEFFVITADLIIGVIIDIFGRKSILIIGQLVSALSIGAIPLFKEVYPWYFICRVSCGLGTIIAVNVPLLPDYVKKDSLGLANSYLAIVSVVTSVLSGTVIFKVAADTPDEYQGWIYYGMSAVIFAVAFFMFYGIVEPKIEEVIEEEEQTARFGQVESETQIEPKPEKKLSRG